MSMNDLLTAFELIEKYKDEAYFSGPKHEDLIVCAEAALGSKFPPTYRAFLEQYGAGGSLSIDIYGLINADFANSGIPDAIWLTLRHRKSYSLPHELILIGELGEGTMFALRTGVVDSDGENPVVDWVPGLDLPLDKLPVTARDFGEYLLHRIENMLDDD